MFRLWRWIRVVLLVTSASPMFTVGENFVSLLDFHETFLCCTPLHYVFDLIGMVYSRKTSPGGRDLLLTGVGTNAKNLK